MQEASTGSVPINGASSTTPRGPPGEIAQGSVGQWRGVCLDGDPGCQAPVQALHLVAVPRLQGQDALAELGGVVDVPVGQDLGQERRASAGVASSVKIS